MRQNVIVLFPIFFFAFLSCSGCIYRTHLVGATQRDRSAAEIITLLENNRFALRSFWGEATVHLRKSGPPPDEQIRHTLLVGILFKSPTQMRAEVYAGLGTNILAFVQKSEHLEVFLPKSKLLLSGNIGTDPLSQVTGIEDLPEIMLDILGSYRLDYKDLASFQSRGDEYVLYFQRNGRMEKYCVDKKSLQVVQKETFGTDGKLLRRIVLKKHVRISGVNLARQAELLSDGFQVNVKFTRQKVNLKIPEGRFKLKVPADTQRISI
ncbi:MAG: hypothetical protein B1H40_00330 [Candidatus Latescibacteria bacterium 4484_181]|nr:MAG: hypothetical protein B1H40_00330 [Candidatus Latescibacteria bacterium 4484_181]RKY69396.1 MAG: hypothetical protein DRQ02_01135 [Candidatus Latescibacterota bacterium]RKY74159.1 MAG: hypothetical protein DRQ24_00490 [Candidatus Latescibacterota bacterium]